MNKLKPILFSTQMVQAILEGRKTQTRRIVFKDNDSLNSPDIICAGFTDNKAIAHFKGKNSLTFAAGENPKYQPGDILWVRESFRRVHHYGFDYTLFQYKDGSTNAHCEIPDPDQIIAPKGWRPSIHMPKEASRIFLEVKDVRVERLQDISEKDVIAEGVDCSMYEGLMHYLCYPPKNKKYGTYAGLARVDGTYLSTNSAFMNDKPWWHSFKSLWESIIGDDSWDANPWVWVYEFERICKPTNLDKPVLIDTARPFKL